MRLDNVLGDNVPDNDVALVRAISNAIFVQTSERLTSVLFWFAILGPLGAALFRFSCLLRNMAEKKFAGNDFANYAERLYFILLWIPARLTALSYAVSGSFVHAFENWRNQSPRITDEQLDNNEVLLVQTGLGALNLEEIQPQPDQEGNLQEIETSLGLAFRSMVVWIVVFSVMTLAGWAS